MADLLDASYRRGKSLTLEQAYEKACQINPDVAAAFSQRKAALAAKEQAQSAQRAQVASSSVKANPAGPVKSGDGPKTLRDSIKAAMAAAEGR